MARGNAGDGGYQQRDNGSWRWRGMIGGKRQSVTGTTKREVQRKVRELLHNADKGILPPVGRLTVTEHFEQWLETEKHSVKPATYQFYAYISKGFVIPAFGPKQIADLRAPQIERLYSELLARGLSPRTVHHVHAVLHAALEQAVRWNCVARNVVGLVDPPKVERREIRALSPEQVRTLLTTLKGDRWETLVRVALATGMRQSELLGLKWADVDLGAGVIQVRRQLSREMRLVETKTGRGRQIDLPPLAVLGLRQHRTSQNENRLLLGSEWEDNDLVFCTHEGRPLGHRNVLRAFKLVLQRAELPAVSFHALRHTAATLMFLNNEPPKVIQERLGHSTIQVTMDIYSHLMPGMGKAAAERLDRFFA